MTDSAHSDAHAGSDAPSNTSADNEDQNPNSSSIQSSENPEISSSISQIMSASPRVQPSGSKSGRSYDDAAPTKTSENAADRILSKVASKRTVFTAEVASQFNYQASTSQPQPVESFCFSSTTSEMPASKSNLWEQSVSAEPVSPVSVESSGLQARASVPGAADNAAEPNPRVGKISVGEQPSGGLQKAIPSTRQVVPQVPSADLRLPIQVPQTSTAQFSGAATDQVVHNVATFDAANAVRASLPAETRKASADLSLPLQVPQTSAAQFSGATTVRVVHNVATFDAANAVRASLPAETRKASADLSLPLQVPQTSATQFSGAATVRVVHNVATFDAANAVRASLPAETRKASADLSLPLQVPQTSDAQVSGATRDIVAKNVATFDPANAVLANLPAETRKASADLALPPQVPKSGAAQVSGATTDTVASGAAPSDPANVAQATLESGARIPSADLVLPPRVPETSAAQFSFASTDRNTNKVAASDPASMERATTAAKVSTPFADIVLAKQASGTSTVQFSGANTDREAIGVAPSDPASMLRASLAAGTRIGSQINPVNGDMNQPAGNAVQSKISDSAFGLNPVQGDTSRTVNPAKNDAAGDSHASSHGIEAPAPQTQHSQVAGAQTQVIAAKGTDAGILQPVAYPAQAVSHSSTATHASPGSGEPATHRGGVPEDAATEESNGSQPAGMSGISAARLIQTMSETEMHVGMRSSEFGDISIRTAVSQQQMQAQISVDHNELGNALSAHIPSVQAKLGSEYGLHTTIEVNQGGASFSNQREHSSQHQQKPAVLQFEISEAPAAVTNDVISLRGTAAASGQMRLDIRA